MKLIFFYAVNTIILALAVLLSLCAKKDALHAEAQNAISKVIKFDYALFLQRPSNNPTGIECEIHPEPTIKDTENSSWPSEKALNYLIKQWHFLFYNVKSLISIGYTINIKNSDVPDFHPWSMVRVTKCDNNTYCFSEIMPYAVGYYTNDRVLSVHEAIEAVFASISKENEYIDMNIQDMDIIFDKAKNDYYVWEKDTVIEKIFINRMAATGQFCDFHDKLECSFYAKYGNDSFAVYVGERQPYQTVRLFFKKREFQKDIIQFLIIAFILSTVIHAIILLINKRNGIVPKGNFVNDNKGQNEIRRQQIEGQDKAIKTQYDYGLRLWEGRSRLVNCCDYDEAVSAIDEIKELDRRFRIHSNHVNMIKRQEDFSEDIFKKIKEIPSYGILRKRKIDIESFDEQANPSKKTYPITICSYGDISEFINGNDKYSQIRLKRYQQEQKILVCGEDVVRLKFYYAEKKENHIDKITSQIPLDHITILGNSGMDGEFRLNFREFDTIFSEDLRTTYQFYEFIYAKTNYFIDPAVGLNHELLAENNIYTLNALPPVDKITRNIVIVDRFADMETIKKTCNMVINNYPGKKINLFYYVFLFCLSQEDTKKQVEEDNVKGKSAEQEVSEYIEMCHKVNLAEIQEKYSRMQNLNYFYCLNKDIDREVDKAFLSLINHLEEAIRNIDIKETERIYSKIKAITPLFKRRWKDKIDDVEEKIESFNKRYLIGIPVKAQELLVDYEYKSSSIVELLEYPFYYSPLLGTPIFPYRRRKILREGVSEQSFYLKLKKYIDCDELSVYNDVSLQVSNQYHYEPDIAVISSAGRNLRIDIEIDEPYSGYDRAPIHCIGYDDIRDQTLINLGWLVIRFSEEQIVTSPLNSIKFICKIISDILPSFEVPERLLRDVNDSKESFYFVSRWTKEEALVMAGDKYRELYLNRSGFGYVEDLSDTTETSGQTITESILSSNVSKKSENNTSASQTKAEAKIIGIVETQTQAIITLPKQRKNRIEVISPYDSTIEEMMRPYFSSMSQEAYREYDKAQHRLDQEILLYYGYNKRRFTESSAFGLIKEYIKTNNIVPCHAGMRVGHPSYHITGRIGFVVGDTLYDAKILRLGARGEDVGLGVAASLGDVPRSRYEIEETIKAEIVEQILNTSIKNMVILEVNLRTNRVSEVKLRRNKVARFILNDGKYDMSIRKI